MLLLALQTQVTGSVSGVVRGFSGKALFDAVVSIASVTRHTRTDSLGQYHIDAVPAGSVHLTAWALGYKTVDMDRIVTGGQQLDVDFRLLPLEDNVRPVASILGVVRTTAGHPITMGPTVAVSEYKRWARVDSTGQYRIDSVPIGAVRVTARSVGYHTISVDTAITTQGEQLHLDFVLRVDTITLTPQVGGSVVGIVRDTAGRRVRSALVTIRGLPGGAVTDSTGRYRIDSVPKGAVRLLARRIGYEAAQADTTLGFGGQGIRVDFVLRNSTLRLDPVTDQAQVTRANQR